MSLDNTGYFPEVDSLEEEKLLIFQTRISLGPSQHRSVPVAHLDFLNSVLNKETTNRLVFRVKGSALLDVIFKVRLRRPKGVVAQH